MRRIAMSLVDTRATHPHIVSVGIPLYWGMTTEENSPINWLGSENAECVGYTDRASKELLRGPRTSNYSQVCLSRMSVQNQRKEKIDECSWR